MIIPICLASDQNYVQHLCVTMASILVNAKESDTIRFYILEQGFQDKDKIAIERLRSIRSFEIYYINVSDKILTTCPIKETDRISVATYFRLFIPELIPNEDKIIYLDCDLIVRHSLDELYQIDMAENYMLGVRDIDARLHMKRLKTKRFINGGVQLINSQKLRENHTINDFVYFINNHSDQLLTHDQDVISAVLNEKLGYIHPKWNGQLGHLPKNLKNSQLSKSYILHYIGKHKPWLPRAKSVLEEEYFKYLRLTPFADFEKQYRNKRFFYYLTPSYWWQFIRKRKQSRLGTYQTTYYLGIPLIKKKAKDALR